MTIIKINYNNDYIVGFEANGHTGYAPIGQDILCASLSSILQTAVLGLMQVANLKINYKTDEKKGKIHLLLEEKNFETQAFKDGQVILKTMVCGIKDVASEFKKYIKVEEIRDVY